MNSRSRNIKKFYYLIHSLKQDDFTFYVHDDVNNKAGTQFYVSNKPVAKVPQQYDGNNVTEISATTFCGKTFVTSVTLTDNIEKIE